jgi:neopullulanase
MYRTYIHQGKMDYLYDKVGFYDTLKGIMQGKQSANTLFKAQAEVADIEQHMLHFLENHDEQRIASPDFAGDAAWGKPAMVVSNLISRSPTLLYFGQDVGEDGSENAGFGSPTRTSIFDYIGVPAHQAWMNNGKFDGANLTPEQAQLRQYYIAIMELNGLPAVVAGDMAPLMVTGSGRVVGFVRTLGQQSLWVLSNFSQQAQTVTITLTPNQATMLKPNSTLYDLLESHNGILVSDDKQSTTFTLTLDALSSAVLTNKADHEL